MSRRDWLILSHAFNMDGRAASQTITDKIPHLMAAGIRIQVMSAVMGARDARFPHDQVLPWGPSALRFDFRHWVADRLGRGAAYRVLTLLASIALAPFLLLERLLVGLSNQWSWAVPVALRGWWRVKTGKVGLVYSTGGAWSAHLAGWWIKRLTGVPWIAEIHDPLVQEGEGGDRTKYREARAQAWLERAICRDADAVWWFTEGALRRARERNPGLGERGFCVPAGAEPPAVRAAWARDETLDIAHFGSLSGTRSLAPFLRAVFALCDADPGAADRIRVHVYGSSLDAEARRLAQQHPRAALVVEHGRLERDPVTGESGREQVVRRMHEADVLLLLHGEQAVCAEYIPSKVYEYFWTRRPVLALTHLNPQLDAMLRERGGYVCESTDPQAIRDALERVWRDWRENRLPEPAAAPVSVKQAVGAILDAVRARVGE